MIDRLIQTRGLLIGHCYMECEYDRARRNVFRRVGGRAAIDPAFETALDYLSERQRSADISTLSFAQLRRCLDFFVRGRLRRTETGWKTELLDGETPYEARTQADDSRQGFEKVTFVLPRRIVRDKRDAAVI
jgi:hypothetical protein